MKRSTEITIGIVALLGLILYYVVLILRPQSIHFSQIAIAMLFGCVTGYCLAPRRKGIDK